MPDINLNPFIHSKMDILFVPLNPPSISNSNGHYFSRVSTFWDILFESGLITNRNFDFRIGDEIVFKNNEINKNKAIYGISDLIFDLIETDSTKVKPNRKHVDYILGIVRKNKVKNLCLMHSRVINAFIKNKIIPYSKKYGFVGTYNNTNIISVPFPTGSSINKETIVAHYREIQNYL